MASTARMILLVDPDEKARWTDEARKVGISTAEYIRRAAANYDPELNSDEAKLLKAATVEVGASIERTAAMLDRSIAEMREANDPDRDARFRAKVMAEIDAMPGDNLSRLREFLARAFSAMRWRRFAR